MNKLINYRLQNFQAHVDTELELHPGINVITGDSDAGKTSINRGIYLATDNKASPAKYVNKHERTAGGAIKAKSEMHVVMGTTKGLLVRVYRGDFNGYYIVPKASLQEFIAMNPEERLPYRHEALNKKPPEELNSVLNVGKVNIQKQKERFMLNDSPGQRGKFINSIVGLDDIDLILSDIAAQRRQTDIDIKVATQAMNKAREELLKLEWVDEALVLVDHINASKTILKSLQNQKEKANEIKASIEVSEKLLEQDQVVYTSEGLIDQILLSIRKRDSHINEKSICQRIIEEIQRLTVIIEEAPDIATIEALVSELVIDINKLGEAKSILTKANQLLHYIRDQGLTIKHDMDTLLELESSFPEICPLCNRRINEHS